MGVARSTPRARTPRDGGGRASRGGPAGPSALPPHPMGLVDVLRTALRLYRDHPRPYLVIAAIVAIPVGALDIAAALWADPGDDARSAGALLVRFVPALLLTAIGAVAATVAAMDQLSGRRPGLSRALEPIGERFWPLMGTLCVIAAAVLVSLVAAVLVLPLVVVLALTVATVYLFVLWLFAPQAAVLERRSVNGALGHSRLLVGGAWLQVFGIFLVSQLITWVAQIALTSAAAPIGARLSGDAEVVAVGAWGVVVLVAVQPFALIAVALLYLDRRFRSDGGWDPLPEPAARGPASG